MRDRLGEGNRRARRWLILPAAALLLGTALSAQAGETGAERAARLSPKIHARIELGRRLFFEPLLSKQGAHACSNCHAPEHGFSDPDRLSIDETGLTRRHSQTIVDSVFNTSAHWDGEFNSVEGLIARRIGDPTRSLWGGSPRTPRGPITPRDPTLDRRDEHGRPLRRPFLNQLALTRFTSPVPGSLEESGRYKEAFRAAFGDKQPTLENITLALAAYCYSVESTESPYDRYAGGDKKALSVSARRGLALFEGRAGCSQCHLSKGPKPMFSDYRFHNTGVAWHEAISKRREETKDPHSVQGLVRRILEKRFDDPKELEAQLAKLDLDRGRARFHNRGPTERAFKTPSLRDVARRAPYLHDGHLDTLADVVRYYADGCGEDPDKDKRLKPFEADDRDVADLVAFLHALTGDERPGLAKRAWKKRAKRARLQVIGPDNMPVPDVAVRLMPSGDAIPVRGKSMDDIWTGVTNSGGWLTYPVPASTHTRVLFADGLEVIGSPLIPDTCRDARVRIPSAGRMTFVVIFPPDYPAPPALVAEHTSMPTTATGFYRTIFPRVGVVKGKDGRVARYSGWIRSDRSTLVTLKLPGLRRSRRGHFKLPTMSVQLEAGTEKRLDLTGN